MSCHVIGSAWQRYLDTGEPLALLPLWGDYRWHDLMSLDLTCTVCRRSPIILTHSPHMLATLQWLLLYTVAVHGGGGGGGGGGWEREGITVQHTALPAMFYFHSFCRWLVSCWTYFTLNYQLIHCLPFKWWPLNPSLVAYLSTQPPLYFSSIVWSTSVTQSRRLCGLSDEEFLLELNTALQRPSEVDRWSPLYTGNNVSIIITLLCHVSDCIWAHQPIPYSLPWFHPWTLLIITYSHTI